jgi:hypothetical protein
MNSIDTQEFGSFKNQFSLVKGGDKNEGFEKNKYSYLNAPTTYNTETITPKGMVPFNTFETLKGDMNNNMTSKMTAGRRDNTIIINDYHTSDVGQYATPKVEQDYLFEPVVNTNALAGDTKIIDKIGLTRYSDTLTYKTNQFPENTNIRVELIDGVPMTEVVRPREKSQAELRGNGVNSIRLAPEGRNNMTGYDGHGTSTDPNSINITKFKMKSYRNQDSIDDLLRTTGVITRPEWRSMVKQTDSDRSYMKSMEGPAMSMVMKTEYHNEQSARPTVKEETIVNTYLSNAVSTVAKETFRNEQAARPTLKDETIINDYISNAFSTVARDAYRNDQAAKPTLRTNYEDNMHILNAKSFVNNTTYHNNQSANPTLRMDYEDNMHILNAKSFVDQSTYHNNQSANPTFRMDYEDQKHILNAKSFVDQTTYHNNQSANPTIRMDYENQMHMLNTKSFVDQNTYRNEQSAIPTLRENAMAHAGHGNNSNAGYVYENNKSANPTLRENALNYAGHGNNNSAGYIYENGQAARATMRTEENEFAGPGYNQSSGAYKKPVDITRSGVVEEVLAKDYVGTEYAFVNRNESRLQSNNMVINEAIESTIDLTKRDLMGGGTDRIPQGRENIGEYVDWNRREKAAPITNRVRNVGINFIEEIPETRGYNLLQERSSINQYVPATLNNNPFINNVEYKASYKRDIIRENTILNDRELDRE